MDVRRLDGVGNNSSIPEPGQGASVEADVGNKAPEAAEMIAQATEVQNSSPLFVDSEIYRNVFAAKRAGKANAQFLDDFIKREVAKIKRKITRTEGKITRIREAKNNEAQGEASTREETPEEQNDRYKDAFYREIFYPDDSFRKSIKANKLISRFSIPGSTNPKASLTDLLQDKLALNIKWQESAVIIKMLVSVNGLDGFISQFIVPYLRKDDGLENFDLNYNFCIRLLNVQDDFSKEAILRSIKYTNFTKFEEIKNMADSLVDFSEPNQILPALFYSSNVLLEQEEINRLTSSDMQDAVIDIPQDINNPFSPYRVPLIIAIALLYAKELPSMKSNQHTFKVPSVEASHLKELYRLAPDPEIFYQSSEFLVNNLSDSANIFKEDFLNKKGEETLFDRYRRFLSIGYYVWANKKDTTVQDSIPTLVDFIKTEESSDLVAKACYMLAEHCGPEGNDALAEVIINQIKNNEQSLPLASLIMLLIRFKSEPYIQAFRKVLSVEYRPFRDLNQAYENLSCVELYTVLRDEKEIIGDPPHERPDLALDLFKEVGLKKMFDLPSNTEGLPTQTSAIERIQMKNLLDLLRGLAGEKEGNLRGRRFYEVRNLFARESFVRTDSKDTNPLVYFMQL